MTFGLLLGDALGASLCLLVFALVPPRPALASVVGRWERQRARQAAVVELDVDDTSRLIGAQRNRHLARLAAAGEQSRTGRDPRGAGAARRADQHGHRDRRRHRERARPPRVATVPPRTHALPR